MFYWRFANSFSLRARLVVKELYFETHTFMDVYGMRGWRGWKCNNYARTTQDVVIAEKQRWRRFIARCHPNFSRLYFCTSDNYPLDGEARYTAVYASIRRRTMIVDESCEPTRVPYSKRSFSQISTRRVTLSNTWRLMLAVLLTGQRSGAL